MVLGTATLGRLWIATVVAVVATLAFNFFFFPPVGTFTIADPQNWVAVIAFLVAVIPQSMPPRILVVDDEPNILSTLAPLLRSRSYDVLTAMNGRDAIETVEREKSDLIVLDLGLPDIDGVEACRIVPRV